MDVQPDILYTIVLELKNGNAMSNQSDTIEHHSAFEWIKTEPVDTLNLQLQIFQHKNTGAMHYHLAADNPENVFLVALRTVPQDSTGVAHILEHTVLCGSERYPVRDPFFMMIRRSLNTFMNAFTSTDWTAYPFASQNKKDFNNLLDVYLDAVFFSRLHELDFAQEGHRLEFTNIDDPDSELQYKGVVYNEMKGAMSAPSSILWHTLCKYLFPSNTYHYNSGGEPEEIPDLTYKQLQAFYRIHYHPSNAVFMTYGDIPAHEHQQKFEQQVLQRFQHLDTQIAVADVKRYYAPIRVEEYYPLDSHDDPQETPKTHLIIGWLLGTSVDLEQKMKAELLSSLLLTSSAAPLRLALETTDLGQAPSSLCGLEDSNKEMSFVCGLEGAQADKAGDFEQLVEAVLQTIIEKGIDQKLLDATLHQLELHQREIGGGSYPYGLELILSGLSTAIHRGDVAQAMNVDRVLHELGEEIKSPDFVPNLIRELLLENPHRVTLTLKPDNSLSARRKAAEQSRLEQLKQQLNDAQKQQIINQSLALQQRQQEQDDDSILPKVTLADIPPDIKKIPLNRHEAQEICITDSAQGTNGLVYLQMVIDLPSLPEHLLALLPLYASFLSELGCDGKSYIETQLWQNLVSGNGITAYCNYNGELNDEQKVRGIFILSSKALRRNYDKMAQLMQKTLHTIRFDETDKIREIVTRKRIKKEQSITASGHHLAMLASGSEMSPLAQLEHRHRGLQSILEIRALEQQIKDAEGMAQFVQHLQDLHFLIRQAPAQFLLVGEEQFLGDYRRQTTEIFAPVSMPALSAYTLTPIRNQVKQAWITSTEVNFCAKSYPVVPIGHPHAPALQVLAKLLSHGFLHRVIREQGGAYGGGATYSSHTAGFHFYSYRDPRVKETLDDFDAAIYWLKNNQHTAQALEEAILGVISALDKPGSPISEVSSAFVREYFGRTHAHREQYRRQVIAVTIEDLQQLADIYFNPQLASMAVVTGNSARLICEQAGMQIFSL